MKQFSSEEIRTCQCFFFLSITTWVCLFQTLLSVLRFHHNSTCIEINLTAGMYSKVADMLSASEYPSCMKALRSPGCSMDLQLNTEQTGRIHRQISAFFKDHYEKQSRVLSLPHIII